MHSFNLILGVIGQFEGMPDLNQMTPEELRAALRDSERKYRAIFDNPDIGIFHIGVDNKWSDVNPTAAAILGYDSADDLLAAQPDFNGRLFGDTEQRAAWIAAIQTQRRHTGEIGFRTKNGSTVWVSLSGHAAVGKGGFDCTIYDVTERRRAELAALRARDDAESANRSKAEFLANMSHELRTPLNAIIGFAEIIKDQMFGPAGNPQYVEYAGDIHSSGQLLLSLINDILDMSKIEAGKRTLAETTLNIDEIVQSVSRLVAARAKEGKVRLNLHVPRDFPALRGEERAMKQILTNLLTNAIKFTPEGGSVTLSAMMSEDRRMNLSVIDSGIGIAPENIAVALAPFGQIESALSRKHQGTGLGLPLTKALVELHGGALELQSQLGSGTTITLRFPAERVVEGKI